MPTLSINFSQLTALAHDAAKAKTYTHDTAWGTLRAASFACEKGIKEDMPVDYGRARASWGHWTASDLKKGGNGASSADAIYDENEAQLNILQGSNVEYIIYLNAGHSRQRAAGFLEKRALKAQIALEERLGLIDPTKPAAQQLNYVAQFS